MATDSPGRHDPVQLRQRVRAALGAVDLAQLEGEQEDRLVRHSQLLAGYDKVADDPIVSVDHVGTPGEAGRW